MSSRRDGARLDDILAAISAIDADLLKTEPAIPWREIAKMRDVLTHHYFGTDDGVVAQVVKEELAPLRDAVVRLREREA